MADNPIILDNAGDDSYNLVARDWASKLCTDTSEITL